MAVFAAGWASLVFQSIRTTESLTERDAHEAFPLLLRRACSLPADMLDDT